MYCWISCRNTGIRNVPESKAMVMMQLMIRLKVKRFILNTFRLSSGSCKVSSLRMK
ncbi:hypothetical protein D3C81_2233490 [compost metagenome]